MHELSVAHTIIEVAEEHARNSGMSSITKIKVCIGSLTTIVPEALSFCFPFAREDTLAATAQLVIEPVSAEARCASCGHTFPVEEAFFLVCPTCNSTDTTLLRGMELDLMTIEGETNSFAQTDSAMEGDSTAKTDSAIKTAPGAEGNVETERGPGHVRRKRNLDERSKRSKGPHEDTQS